MPRNAPHLLNLTLPIPASSRVSFFRSTPRWPSATKDFAFTFDYLTPAALTSLLPIIFAVVLTILLFLLLAYRYTRNEPKIDARLHRAPKSTRLTTTHIGLGAILTLLIAVFISLGLLGNVAVNASASDALAAVRALLTDVRRAGFAVADLLLLFDNRLRSFNPSSVPESALSSVDAPDVVRPALRAVQGYVLANYPQVGPLRDRLDVLVRDIADVLAALDKAVDLVYAALLALILLQFTAPVLLLASDSVPVAARSRACRIALHVTFLLVPALLAWLLVGVASATGNVVADVCESVHEYRSVLLGEIPAADAASNALVESGIVCPDILDPATLTDQIGSTSDSLLQSALARETVKLLVNESAEAVAASAVWTGDEVLKFVDCSGFLSFSGRVEGAVCGQEGWSAIEGVFNMWVAFLGLALALTAAFVASLLGVRVAWSVLVFAREMPQEVGKEYEGIDEGDVREVVVGEGIEVESVVPRSFGKLDDDDVSPFR